MEESRSHPSTKASQDESVGGTSRKATIALLQICARSSCVAGAQGGVAGHVSRYHCWELLRNDMGEAGRTGHIMKVHTAVWCCNSLIRKIPPVSVTRPLRQMTQGIRRSSPQGSPQARRGPGVCVCVPFARCSLSLFLSFPSFLHVGICGLFTPRKP